jgi:NADH-quinone oxidoreductase subunit N
MFSLAGLPPIAGLWGKLLIFGSALNVHSDADASLRWWFVALAVIGVLNAAIAAYYYLKIVGLMYFREPLSVPRAEGGAGAALAAIVCSAAVLVFGFYPAPLIRECLEAGKDKPAEASVADSKTDAAPVQIVAKSDHE